MTDRFKFRMWSTHAGRYFDETNDAMLEKVFECMKQQICYDCQNPVFRKIYDRIAYNHIAHGMVFEQCTGLKDKNGKLIYEGDICRIKGTYYDCDYKEYFEIDENEEVDSLEKFFGEAMLKGVYSALGCDTLQVEVIGNIHENADLFEVGGK